jgi:hypothetical protein
VLSTGTPVNPRRGRGDEREAGRGRCAKHLGAHREPIDPTLNAYFKDSGTP